MTETTNAPARRQRKSRQGLVTSDKMTNTALKARNELGAKTGDLVRIMETRPLAKTVNWRVVEIVQRAK